MASASLPSRSMASTSRKADNASVLKAISDGRFADLSTLLDQGYDFESRDKDGNTALHIATKNGDARMIDLLIKKGAQVDVRDTWASWTALHHAIWAGKKVPALALLRSGANPNARDKEGQTPLHLAAMRGRTVEALLLLDFKSAQDLRDQKLFTPLHCAAAFGSLDIIHLLLDRGADMNVRNKEGKTPLQMAEVLKRTDVLDLLRKGYRVPHSPGAAEDPHSVLEATKICHCAEVGVLRAQEALTALKFADKLRLSEESADEAANETRRLKRLLEEKDVKVQAAMQREAAANKRVAEEVEKWKEAHKRLAEEEAKRKEADQRRRALEKQMADAMHTLSEGEESRAEMEKELKLERTVREMTEARALEEEVKRSKAEARLNGEISARQDAEAKLKEKLEWYKLVAAQISDMEKGRQEDKAKVLAAERQKTGLEEQVKELRSQKAQVEAAVKEEQDKRVKAEEKLRKAEAFSKEEKRLRLEEEKLRKDTQNLLSVAEAKTLEESKRRARAEIRAMAEENKRTELEEKLQEKQRALDSLQAELASLRLSQLPAAAKEQGPAVPSSQVEGPRETPVSGEGQEGDQGNVSSATLNPVATGTSDALGLSAGTDLVVQCLEAFKGILQASKLGREAVSAQELSDFTAKLRSAAPAESTLWTEVFQALLHDGVCIIDVEELKRERDVLKSTLKEMAAQVAGAPRDEVTSQGMGVEDCQPAVTAVDVAPNPLQQQVEALQAELKETRRHQEEAEMRCQALEQLLAKEPLAKASGAAQATGLASKGGETVTRPAPSMLERFSFKTRVFNVPDQKG